ncbi:ER-golgi trafficking TRAPP I complex 85 kDa subunit-domain-containing protein [Leucosporidium creatinivorum]|uniref:ER-golgi trafficking TRAPP I complex 85 kDa subunit-domain-containing protein n=1 Tax=Leucosporidium creatinivorum TaxID=106004 RepID=A0A1Y2F8M5_9BASI|nr:ER-golgi trafficking TRAPP I complex 85 kDa subunit-domain-containing protein [Leucosporidium creatinivorum]
MASLPPPTPQAQLISPHFSPILHTFTTPDLYPILARSNLQNTAHLLSAFQDSVDKVTVRSTNYEPRLLPRFGVRFVERELPKGWGAEEGARGGGRQRSASTAATPGRTPLQSFEQPTTPMTPAHQPTPAEQDELFLDSVSSLLIQRTDSWLAQTGREELDVRGVQPRRRVAEREEGEGKGEVEEEEDEGWKGRSVESLTPWYKGMRDEVLRRREMCEWETFGWPVACVLALSTSHPSPLNALSSLWDLTSPPTLYSPTSFPPTSPHSTLPSTHPHPSEYVDPSPLRYILLIHDFGAGSSREGWEDAQVLAETIRKTYGLHTKLVGLFRAGEGALQAQPRARGVSALWAGQEGLGVGVGVGVGVGGERKEMGERVVGLGVTDDEDPTAGEVGLATPSTTTTTTSLASRGAEPIETGHELSDEDLKSLRVFMRELVVQSVVPWIERQVVVGNEQYTASKRSIGGRLFSAGRKYFGGGSSSGGGGGGGSGSAGASRSGSPVGGGNGWNAVKGYYPTSSLESQTRRLADLAFTLGDYKLSSQIYESLVKDFKGDRAWRYFAGASRMAGLSHLLLHPPATPLPFNPDVYLSQATQTPWHLSGAQAGVVDLDGLKAVMLYYEAYRVVGDWRAAPEGLVRGAGEIDEISSALLLEQAALADLHLPKPSRRKYAFHLAMAAARYEKSGLKSLSRRCLSQSSTLYRIPILPSPVPSANPTNPPTSDPRYPSSSPLSSWSAIRSHLHHGLGRQAYNVGKAGDAVQHFLELLKGKEMGEAGVGGGGGGGGEEDWLDDFGLAWEHLGPTAPQLLAERNLSLPITIFDPKETRVRVLESGNVSVGDAKAVEWRELEEVVLGKGGRKRGGKEEQEGREAVVGETFYLELLAVNPLDAALAIGGLQIETDAEEDGAVEIDAPQEIELAPREALRIYIPIRATKLLSLSFTRLSFRFNDLLPCLETLPTTTTSHLSIKVRSPIPILSISLESLPPSLWAGEGRMTSLTLTNTGQVELRQLRGVCGEPAVALFDDGEGEGAVYEGRKEEEKAQTVENRLLPNEPKTIGLKDGALQPGESIQVPILLRGDSVGAHTLRWFFTFHGVDDSELLTSRAAFKLQVLPSLDLKPSVRPSSSTTTPHVLSLEIYNPSIPTDVIITQITSLSPRWKCSLLPGFSFTEDVQPLGWQQSLNVVLQVEPTEDDQGAKMAEKGAEWAVGRLDELLRGKDVKAKGDGPGEVKLQRSTIGGENTISTSTPRLFNSLLRTHTTLRHLSLSTQLPTISPTLHSSLFPLFSPSSLDLLLFWQIPSTGQQGHHHLADIPLGAGHDRLKAVLELAELKAGGLYAESQRERTALLAGLRRSELGVDEMPAQVSVVVEENGEHEFERGPCILPVSFTIRNLSPTLSFDFDLTLQDLSKPSPDVVYAGSLTHRGTAAPLSLTTISSQLFITRQGAYDVGGWKLAVSREGASWIETGKKREVRIRDRRALAPPPATSGASATLVDVGA